MKPNDTQPLAWSRKQVASQLNIGLRSLDRLDADKSPARTFPLPVYIVGRKRWIAADVQAWLIAQSKIPTRKSR